MRILMLGGGVFLGRALSRSMRDRGWELSCLTRGRSRPGPVEGLRLIQGDRRRSEDLKALAAQDWDAIVDTCAYRPADLDDALEILGDSCACWMLISTISVYAPPYPRNPTEEAPLLPPVDPEAELAPNYGALKAMCEDMLREAVADRALVVRPGLIVGPEDPSERFTWWVRELAACAASGRTPSWPDARRQPCQWIDVRDLAEFCTHLLAEGAEGTVQVAGPARPPSFSEAMERMARVLAPQCPPRPLPEEAWLAAGIQPWADLPLWLPEADYPQFDLDISAALGAGLAMRPLEETALDTLAWLRDHAPSGRGPDLAGLLGRLAG